MTSRVRAGVGAEVDAEVGGSADVDDRRADPLASSMPAASGSPPPRVTAARVTRRRLLAIALVVAPVAWALGQALAGGSDLVNPGGVSRLADLAATALSPSLDPAFLLVVLDAAATTVVFAILGTAGALVIGGLGALVLGDAAWGSRPPLAVRVVRFVLRGILVATRSVHELVWALLFVSVLGLDPMAAVLAIALPFGAQTAKVFAETLDAVPTEPFRALRRIGARRGPALLWSTIPEAAPMLLSYSFYRFECALRSVVVLGVVGVGGLGQELVVSLQSRNWDEVWTLIAAVILLSAVVDLWSSRLRGDLAVVSCADWSSGRTGSGAGRGARGSRWAPTTVAVAVAGLVVAIAFSGVSAAGLVSERTRLATGRLLDELWPPQLPPGGAGALLGGMLDTLAMAVLAMVVAVAITLVLGPVAARMRRGPADESRGPVLRVARGAVRGGARGILLVLRSVPPTVWAIVALFALFPGVLPGALALGLYTGGILGRLVAEAWESVPVRPRDALRATGVRSSVATLAAVVPPSARHLTTYTLYRFEICVRDTAVVGVVGAAGLGRLLAESLAAFAFPVVTTLLLASLAVSALSELAGRALRRALGA